MRIAIVSDPHGDLVALNTVIADVEQQEEIDEIVLAGDLAQGGPQPAEVIDEIAGRGWRSVRGNADDLLVRVARGEPLGMDEPDDVVQMARWSADRLGPDRVEFLRSLPLALDLTISTGDHLVIVHSTPWSNQDVVLPDAAEEVAQRVIDAAGGRVVAYGHIHTPYQRLVGDSVLLSVGAISTSNDADPRAAYTIIDAGEVIRVEVRRVECPVQERLAAYERAGIELSDEKRARLTGPGPLPVRSREGVSLRVWPLDGF